MKAWYQRNRTTVRPITATGWIAIVSFFVSIVTAKWLRDDLHYIIGDSLARTANAVYVVADRDPHAGAIGFYWPPLHSVLQIPFVLLLRPLGAIEWAGPLTSALALALTVALLGHMARGLGVGVWAAAGICAAFAFNPVMVFYGANGMSETTFLLFLVLAFDGFIHWCRDDSNGPLTTCAMALAALVLIRVEAVLVVVVFVAVGAWAGRSIGKTISHAILIGLPAAFAFAIWLIAQLLLTGDALYFLHTNASVASENRPWLPAPSDTSGVLRWAASWLVVFGVALAACTPVLADRLRPRTQWRRSAELRIAAVLLGSAAVFPALHAYLLMRNATTGNPRYFTAVTAVGAVGAVWAASPSSRLVVDKVWNVALVGGLAATAVVSVLALTSPVRAKVEQENLVFDSALGRDRHVELARLGATWMDFRALSADIDRMVPPTSRVLADSTYAFPLVVFSEKRRTFVIPNDRDFEPTLADPDGKVDFVITANEAFLRHRFGGRLEDPVGAVVSGSPSRWSLVASHGSISLYRSVDGLLGSRRPVTGPA